MSQTLYETISDIARDHGCKGYFVTPDDLIGVRSKGFIRWFRYSAQHKGYVVTGSTLRPKSGATYSKLRAK